MAGNTPDIKEEKKGVRVFEPATVSEEVMRLRTQILIMKSSFNASLDNLVTIQDLHEKMLKDMLKKGKKMEADDVKMVNDFIENAKKERDEYRKVMEAGFMNMEEIFKPGK